MHMRRSICAAQYASAPEQLACNRVPCVVVKGQWDLPWRCRGWLVACRGRLPGAEGALRATVE